MPHSALHMERSRSSVAILAQKAPRNLCHPACRFRDGVTRAFCLWTCALNSISVSLQRGLITGLDVCPGERRSQCAPTWHSHITQMVLIPVARSARTEAGGQACPLERMSRTITGPSLCLWNGHTHKNTKWTCPWAARAWGQKKPTWPPLKDTDRIWSGGSELPTAEIERSRVEDT